MSDFEFKEGEFFNKEFKIIFKRNSALSKPDPASVKLRSRTNVDAAGARISLTSLSWVFLTFGIIFLLFVIVYSIAKGVGQDNIWRLFLILGVSFTATFLILFGISLWNRQRVKKLRFFENKKAYDEFLGNAIIDLGVSGSTQQSYTDSFFEFRPRKVPVYANLVTRFFKVDKTLQEYDYRAAWLVWHWLEKTGNGGESVVEYSKVCLAAIFTIEEDRFGDFSLDLFYPLGIFQSDNVSSKYVELENKSFEIISIIKSNNDIALRRFYHHIFKSK